MECKDGKFKFLTSCCPGINRNILECKEIFVDIRISTFMVLIETYWNVKEDVQLFLKRLRKVLIETYWNVKIEYNKMIMRTMSVLIETYWNVKVLVTRKRIFQKDVLIETYWNVKDFDEKNCVDLSLSINRNILECKGITQLAGITSSIRY